MITTGELKKSIVLVLDGELYRVLDYQHVKQGRGSAMVRITLRNLRTGATTERTFPAGSKFEDVELDRAVVQYQYADGDTYHFMDTASYDQVTLTARELGTARNYLRGDGVQFTAVGHRIYQLCRERGLGVDLPRELFLQDEKYIP